MVKTPASWDSTYMPDQKDRIAIVTGANSGIGYFTALALARKHAHVILGCRNEMRGLRAQQDIREETGNVNVEFMQVDVGSIESVRSFSETIHARFNHIDLLINNAGIMVDKDQTTPDGFEANLGTNYLGPFHLTSLLFDQLKKSKEARIVNVSSFAHSLGATDFKTVGYPPAHRQSQMKAYGISKLALNLFTFELDRRLRAAGLEHVKAIGVHPGTALTNFMHFPPWFAKVYDTLTSCMINTPETAALPSLFAATEETIEGGEYIGPSRFWGLKGPPARVEASAQSHSQEDAANLWTRSEDLLHCRFDVQQGGMRLDNAC